MNTKSHKRKRIAYNVISGIGGQVLIIILGFMIPRLFLVNFGSEVNGIVSTINQIFTYLCLLEAGVGLATLQALYSPVAEGDCVKINCILTATDKYYKKTGIVYAVLVVILAIGYSAAVETTLPGVTVFWIVVFCGTPNVISYLVLAKWRLFLQAEGKNYILNNMEAAMYMLVSIGKILLLIFTDNIILVQFMQCVGTLIQVIYFEVYLKKHYSWLNLKEKPDYESISQKSSVLIHQISGVIFNNTDVILLSVFCDFKIVSVYTTYNLFFTYIEKLITATTSGITFSLGQMFHTDKKRFLEFHNAYETLYMVFVFTIYSLVGLFLLPFIRLYTQGVNDINYVDFRLLLLFIGVNLLANGKLPSNQVINFAEHFEQTKNRAITEAVINIVVSVEAIQLWGIYGGLLGTIAALLYRGNDMIFYANHKILKRSVFCTYRKWLVNAGVFAVVIKVASVLNQNQVGYISLFINAGIYGILILILYIVVNFLLERKSFIFLWDYLKEGRRCRNNSMNK